MLSYNEYNESKSVINELSIGDLVKLPKNKFGRVNGWNLVKSTVKISPLSGGPTGKVAEVIVNVYADGSIDDSLSKKQNFKSSEVTKISNNELLKLNSLSKAKSVVSSVNDFVKGNLVYVQPHYGGKGTWDKSKEFKPYVVEIYSTLFSMTQDQYKKLSAELLKIKNTAMDKNGNMLVKIPRSYNFTTPESLVKDKELWKKLGSSLVPNTFGSRIFGKQ